MPRSVVARRPAASAVRSTVTGGVNAWPPFVSDTSRLAETRTTFCAVRRAQL